MSDWDDLLDESRRLEEAARKIQPQNPPTHNTTESSHLSQSEIDDVVNSYHAWYGNCLSILPNDLKQKFRFSYESDGYSAPYIKKFLQAPLDRTKTYPNGRRGKVVYAWRYPFQKYFSHPLQDQRQILIEARSRNPKETQSQNIFQQTEIGKRNTSSEEGSEDLGKVHHHKVTQQSRKRFVFTIVGIIILANLLWILGIVFSKCFHAEFAESPLQDISEASCQAAGDQGSLRNFSMEAFSLSLIASIMGPLVNGAGLLVMFLTYASPLPPVKQESHIAGINRNKGLSFRNIRRKPKVLIGMIILALLVILTGTKLYFTLQPQSTLLYQVDFSHGSQGWLKNTLSNQWRYNLTDKVIESNGSQKCCDYGNSLDKVVIDAPHDINQKDYVVEARVKVIGLSTVGLGTKSNANTASQPPFFGLFVRGLGFNTQGYLSGIWAFPPKDPYSESLSFLVVAGQSPHDYNGENYEPVNQWQTYKVVVKGNTFMLYVDNTSLYPQPIQDSTLQSGSKVGIEDFGYILQVQSFKVYTT